MHWPAETGSEWPRRRAPAWGKMSHIAGQQHLDGRAAGWMEELATHNSAVASIGTRKMTSLYRRIDRAHSCVGHRLRARANARCNAADLCAAGIDRVTGTCAADANRFAGGAHEPTANRRATNRNTPHEDGRHED